MTAKKTFLWATFGSVLPEVLRFYRLTVEDKPLPIHQWWQYVIVSLVFMFFAGMFSVAWRPQNAFRAVWLGATFPLAVAQLIASVPGPK